MLSGDEIHGGRAEWVVTWVLKNAETKVGHRGH